MAISIHTSAIVDINERATIEASDSAEPLILEFTTYPSSIVADPTNVNNWNTFFDLPVNGRPITSVSVDGNIIKLYGGKNITIKNSLFAGSDLIAISDLSWNIIIAEAFSFSNASNLTTIYLPNLISAGQDCFGNCTSVTTIDLPNCTTIGDGCFYFQFALTTINLPKCVVLGSTLADNSVFGSNSSVTSATFNVALQNVDGFGNPDGDISYLIGLTGITPIYVS